MSKKSDNEEVEEDSESSKKKKPLSLLERMKIAGHLTVNTATNAPELIYGDGTPSSIPALNIAQRGDLFKGPVKGIKQICGKSSTFKTLIALMEAKSYIEYWLSKGEDPYILFYSNEHGASLEYLRSVGIDTDRVLYIPFMGIEDLMFDAAKRFNELKLGDRVMTIIDSIGMAASTKEANDMLDGKDKQDMTRAKKLNSFARVVAPHMVPKDLYMVIINHIYADQTVTYEKWIVSGGEKLYLASQEVWIMKSRQLKDGDERVGQYFDIHIDKSRFVRKFSKIPLGVSFETGVLKHSGLLEIALKSGHVIVPVKGYITRRDVDLIDETAKTKGARYRKWRAKQADSNDEFWSPILEDPTFNEFVRNLYQLSGDLSVAEKVTSASYDDMDEETKLDLLLSEGVE